MKKELYIGAVTFMLMFALVYVPVVYAQNLTTNASNTMGNASANVNQTANTTLSNIMNKTGELGKKIVGGAADIVSNISEEVKQGIGAK